MSNSQDIGLGPPCQATDQRTGSGPEVSSPARDIRNAYVAHVPLKEAGHRIAVIALGCIDLSDLVRFFRDIESKIAMRIHLFSVDDGTVDDAFEQHLVQIAAQEGQTMVLAAGHAEPWNDSVYTQSASFPWLRFSLGLTVCCGEPRSGTLHAALHGFHLGWDCGTLIHFPAVP